VKICALIRNVEWPFSSTSLLEAVACKVGNSDVNLQKVSLLGRTI